MAHENENHGREPIANPPGSVRWLFHLRARTWRPLERFLRVEAASGVLLLAAAGLALAWASSPWRAGYAALWQTPLGLRVGGFVFERDLAWFVNDVLMVVFFFVVGLEIKRELHHGELSEPRRAALPALAALGGMLVPAGVFLLAAPIDAHAGWGTPMATDIAFAVGVLALLGPRVPPALRVLLLALAVIDDLGAIIVIALFYSSGVSLAGILAALGGIGGVLLLQALGVRSKLAYAGPAACVWGGVYAAGVHPTIAGVIVGLLTPVKTWLGTDGLARAHAELTPFAAAAGADPGGATRVQESSVPLSAAEMTNVLDKIAVVQREASSPAERLIHVLHPWVAYGIMPLFALANAGVSLDGLDLDGKSQQVALATGLGLLLGKPLGVLLAVGLCVRLGVAVLPVGLGPRHVLVLGVVAGIGFTMALFIAQLAYIDQPSLLPAAKLGVLTASGLAGLMGVTLGRILLSRQQPLGAAATVTEAENSTRT